ncbi:MAG: histidinol phosphate phosphatase [Candidatus Omnitrophica bacterium]|nr:histidinol phosphate phosphatase [Candidatus Omnitrophota bacterium]
MSDGNTLLAWVERQVDACRPIALRYFRAPGLVVRRKADGSPVTAADRAVEERLRRALARAHPGERIVGEEYGDSGGGASTYWTIDPIDGTRAFSRGLPTWGVMVGRVERGVPVLGVIDYPAIGARLVIAPGVPAGERQGRRFVRFPRVSGGPRLADAVLFHGGTRYWARTPYRARFYRLLTVCYLERAFGDCYGFLWAFRGCADAVLEYGVKPWDLVPLAAAARALGWTFTDCAGHPGFLGPELVMAKPGLLPALTRALRGDRA